MKQWISHFSGTIRLLLLLQYSVLKAKPYLWSMYNIITIMAQTFWHTSEALVQAGNVTAYTCVAHAYNFFFNMHVHFTMYAHCNRIRVYKYLNSATLAVGTLCTDTASTLVSITNRTYWTLWRWCPAKLLLLLHITLCQCWNTNKIRRKIVFQCIKETGNIWFDKQCSNNITDTFLSILHC
jgi:hypothetical protein